MMDADVLATQGARASPTMIFTLWNRINSVPNYLSLPLIPASGATLLITLPVTGLAC